MAMGCFEIFCYLLFGVFSEGQKNCDITSPPVSLKQDNFR